MRYFGHSFIMLYVAADLSIGVLACHPIKFNNATIMPINLQSIMQFQNYKNSSIEGSWETALQQLDKIYANVYQY